MQIIINIPEEEYKCVQITGHIGNATQVSNAIFNGTLLLEGHGRLIDADSFKETLDYYIREGGWSKEHNESLEWCKEFIDAELTVIEADEEVENEGR